jgi:hypothetical protein
MENVILLTSVYYRNRMAGVMHRIRLVQDRDQWQALVNTVMNLRVPYRLFNWIKRGQDGATPHEHR